MLWVRVPLATPTYSTNLEAEFKKTKNNKTFKNKDLILKSFLNISKNFRIFRFYALEQTAWLHVLATTKSTLYFPHGKRGAEVMNDMGVLKSFDGILCNDHWKPYLGFKCKHSLCNAHHLRELQWVIDFKNHKWAKSMQKFLKKLNIEVDEDGGDLPEEDQRKKDTKV